MPDHPKARGGPDRDRTNGAPARGTRPGQAGERARPVTPQPDLCAACQAIAAAPHRDHHPRALRLRTLDYGFYGTLDGTGAAVTQRHFVCEVCTARWAAKAKPDGSCCDWRQE